MPARPALAFPACDAAFSAALQPAALPPFPSPSHSRQPTPPVARHPAPSSVVLHGGTPRMARRPSLKGDLDVKSVFTAKLPSSPPGFARQIYVEMSDQWKGSPLPTEPWSFLLASFQLWKLGDPKCKTTEGDLSSWHRWQHKFEWLGPDLWNVWNHRRQLLRGIAIHLCSFLLKYEYLRNWCKVFAMQVFRIRWLQTYYFLSIFIMLPSPPT